MQHLTTIEDQLRFLDAVARHLEPGGRFVFDVFNPHFAALTSADGVAREDTPEQRLADGRSFRRAARVLRVRWVEQVSEIELLYHMSPTSGAPTQRYVQAFDMRWYLRAELVHLPERSGFHIRTIFGAFDRAELTDGSPEQIVIAECR